MQEVLGGSIPPLLDGVREQLIPASVILLRIAWVERAILYSNLVCDKNSFNFNSRAESLLKAIILELVKYTSIST